MDQNVHRTTAEIKLLADAPVSSYCSHAVDISHDNERVDYGGRRIGWLFVLGLIVGCGALVLMQSEIGRSPFVYLRTEQAAAPSTDIIVTEPGEPYTVSAERRPRQLVPSGRKMKQTKMEQAYHRNNEEYRRVLDPDVLFEGVPWPFKGVLSSMGRALGRLGSCFQDPQEAKKALGIEGFSQY